jgi:hypothetical protein
MGGWVTPVTERGRTVSDAQAHDFVAAHPQASHRGRYRVLGLSTVSLSSLRIHEDADEEPVLFLDALTSDKKTARFRIRKPLHASVEVVIASRARRKWSICRAFDAPGRIRTCDPRIRSPPLTTQNFCPGGSVLVPWTTGRVDNVGRMHSLVAGRASPRAPLRRSLRLSGGAPPARGRAAGARRRDRDPVGACGGT